MLRRRDIIALSWAVLVACHEDTSRDEVGSKQNKPAMRLAEPKPSMVLGPPLGVGDSPPISLLHLNSEQSLDLVDEDNKILLFFYPRLTSVICGPDLTQFRRHHDEFRSRGIRVVGVSVLNESQAAQVIKECELPFSIVLDNGEVAQAFEVPIQNGHLLRRSFLIKEAKIARVWYALEPEQHIRAVLSKID